MAPRCWAVVPAAGLGARMGATVPKQYLPLLGEPVLLHTLSGLLGHPRLDGVVVALAEADRHWPAVQGALLQRWPRARLLTAAGGAERCHSVLSALCRLAVEAAAHDWVLVHDAARPCLRAEDVNRLLDAASAQPAAGAILATPVRDTMKRVGADRRITDTIAREALWQAQTPQMFRLGDLEAALTGALRDGLLVTDEASAMEHAGHRPLVVQGHQDNLKITHPEDLALASLYLHARRGSA